jgi:hypothetical protein
MRVAANSTRTLMVLLAVALALPVALCAQNSTPEYGKRIRTYLKFVNQRAHAIHSLAQSGTDPAQLRARMEEFTRLSNELCEAMMTADAAGADVHKEVKAVADASQKWPDALAAPAPSHVYDYSRKLADDAARNVSEEAARMTSANTPAQP